MIGNKEPLFPVAKRSDGHRFHVQPIPLDVMVTVPSAAMVSPKLLIPAPALSGALKAPLPVSTR